MTSRSVASRSTRLPAHMGKATASLMCKVPEVVKDDWQRLAVSLGSNESELLREWVMFRLYGREALLRMHEERLAAVVGEAHESLPGG